MTNFEEAHNHLQTPSRYVHLFPTYRGMTDANKAQVDSLHSFGIRTCHIMGHMVAFTNKDLYNQFRSEVCGEIKDLDVAALSYLHWKANNDPVLFAKFSTTSDGKWKHLFWVDGCSNSDFLFR